MASELERWASAEREFLQNELKWFKAGAKLLSPSGGDITARKLEELDLRLEHVQMALEKQNDAPRI